MAVTPAPKDASLKVKLRRVEDELSEARDERVKLVATRDEAREKYAGSEDISPDSAEFKEAEKAVKELGECDEKIAKLQEVQIGMLRMLGDEQPATRAIDGRNDDQSKGWDSSKLFADEEVRERLRYISTSKARFGGVDLGQVISRDALAADVTGTADMRRGEWRGIIPQLRRMLRVLDLIPTGTMDGNVLPYTEESGEWTGPAETAEGSEKPEAGVTFTDKEATARTIAAWMKLQKQSLSDFSALRTIVDSRLRYGVERRLEGQVLNGDGEAPNLKGILKTAGHGLVKYAAAELLADQILRSITTVLLADAIPSGVVLTPTIWQEILLKKSTFATGEKEGEVSFLGGSGQYYSGGPFAITPQTIWGVPCVPSAAVPAGNILTGDFELGVTLFIREGVNVLLSDSDQDDFIKNKVTLLGEMRAALAEWRPACFCITFATLAAEEAHT